jgi:hypothetical protein
MILICWFQGDRRHRSCFILGIEDDDIAPDMAELRSIRSKESARRVELTPLIWQFE